MPRVVTKAQRGPFAGGRDHRREPAAGDGYTRAGVSIHFDHIEKLYDRWPTPTCIISDGPYGVGGFPGDSHAAESLADRYRPHVEAWDGPTSAPTANVPFLATSGPSYAPSSGVTWASRTYGANRR